jgi:hypothetical protein
VERTLSSSETRKAKVVTPIFVIVASVVVGAWVQRDEWSSRPLYSACFVLALTLFALGFCWWTGYWRLADSVVEVSAGLRVRRGEHDVLVTFREISAVGHRPLDGQSVCVLELHAAGPLGARIEFLAVPNDEGERLVGMDLWEYLEMQVARAQAGR